MMRRSLLLLSFTMATTALSQSSELGLFSDHGDVGDAGQPGTASYDADTGTYTVGGSGENMWAAEDGFHYVWTQVSGDAALLADLSIPAASDSSQPHRKACLVIRQTLEPDSVYADAALHGDGLTSLQFRSEKGGDTREVQSNVTAPTGLGIEKVGDSIYMLIAEDGGELKPSGCSIQLPFEDEFYIGLAVCAHDNSAFETATFSNVALGEPSGKAASIRSCIETMAVASGDRRCVYHTPDLIDAPNWTPDGEALIYNGGGRLYRLSLAAGSEPEPIDTGFAVNCNNDHGISPDGTQLVISDQTENGQSIIYTLPITGGEPKRVTPNSPSYWHGWSPDGKTLAYCAGRDGNYDIYTIPVEGGDETRLTTAEGLDDGPDYSPNGEFIYFNSSRTGLMQIWRMKPDATRQEQVTSDDYNNWFAHPSPDGQWIVFLSYEKDVDGHPRDKDVMLRMMPADGEMPTGGDEITELASFFGGQGTINVPSWSPDSQHIAYVRYQPAAPQ